MPIRKRMNSFVPIDAMIDFKPLCPPAEPRSRMRIFPTGNARSSEITTSCPIRSAGDSLSIFRSKHATACPLRFMKVCGFTNFVRVPSISPRPTSELHSRLLTLMPSSWANLSINMNPRLCRVDSYSFPGFPKPTINIRQDLQDSIRIYMSISKNLVNPVQQLSTPPRPRPLPSCPCQSLQAQRALQSQPQALPLLPSRYRQWR